jgi:hypothetical protein
MYYVKTRADNSGYTNHRVICLVVIGTSFNSEQVFQVSNVFLPRMLFKMLIQDKSPLTKSTSIIMKIKMFFFYTFLARLRRKKVELLSSLRRQRLGRLSFLSESISQKLSKVSIWNIKKKHFNFHNYWGAFCQGAFVLYQHFKEHSG